MGDDQRAGTGFNGPTGDFPRVDHGLRNGALEHFFGANQPVLTVQKQHHKALPWSFSQPEFEKCTEFGWRIDGRAGLQGFAQTSAAELESGLQDGAALPAPAGLGHAFVRLAGARTRQGGNARPPARRFLDVGEFP
jgi:hypothetical protein